MDRVEFTHAVVRVRESAILSPYEHSIAAALADEMEDCRWVATAPEQQVLQWAKVISHSYPISSEVNDVKAA